MDHAQLPKNATHAEIWLWLLKQEKSDRIAFVHWLVFQGGTPFVYADFKGG